MHRRHAGALLAWVMLGMAGAAVWALASGRVPAQAQQAADEASGAQVYAVHCAACHGPDGGGGAGEGLRAGPALRGLELALVDQQVRTGRMPIAEPAVGVVGPEELPQAQREVLVAWMAEAMDLRGAIPEVGEGDAGRGHELYAVHCAACHGTLGQGGVGAQDTTILGVLGHDRVALVEAMRVGPYDMPRFAEGVLSDDDAADIAAFVVSELDGADTGPLGLSEMGPVLTAGMVGVVALGLLGLVVLLGHGVRVPPAADSDHAGDRGRGGAGG